LSVSAAEVYILDAAKLLPCLVFEGDPPQPSLLYDMELMR
jgi:hypothetical protein